MYLVYDTRLIKKGVTAYRENDDATDKIDDRGRRPAGWVLTNSSVPATIRQTDDGRTRLEYINPRADEIDVIITARQRAQ